MNESTPSSSDCANTENSLIFDEVMKLVGDFWTLHIVNTLRDNEMRFSELQRSIPGLNPVTLTNRLKKMEEAEMVTRAMETCDKQSVSYSLTEKGRGVLPILSSIQTFANNHW